MQTRIQSLKDMIYSLKNGTQKLLYFQFRIKFKIENGELNIYEGITPHLPTKRREKIDGAN